MFVFWINFFVKIHCNECVSKKLFLCHSFVTKWLKMNYWMLFCLVKIQAKWKLKLDIIDAFWKVNCVSYLKWDQQCSKYYFLKVVYVERKSTNIVAVFLKLSNYWNCGVSLPGKNSVMNLFPVLGWKKVLQNFICKLRGGGEVIIGEICKQRTSLKKWWNLKVNGGKLTNNQLFFCKNNSKDTNSNLPPKTTVKS